MSLSLLKSCSLGSGKVAYPRATVLMLAYSLSLLQSPSSTPVVVRSKIRKWWLLAQIMVFHPFPRVFHVHLVSTLHSCNHFLLLQALWCQSLHFCHSWTFLSRFTVRYLFTLPYKFKSNLHVHVSKLSCSKFSLLSSSKLVIKLWSWQWKMGRHHGIYEVHRDWSSQACYFLT